MFAKTLRLALESLNDNYTYVKKLNTWLREALSTCEDIVINSPEVTSPYILNISVLCIGSEVMLNALNDKGFAVSAQSTCSSKSKAISHVLLEMGLGELRATHAIRISMSHMTTMEELELFVKAIKEVIHDYRTK